MRKIVTSLTADKAIEKLLSAVEHENMRVVAHINGQANAAKMGKKVAADQILEIFRPDFAIQVWEACKEAGIDIPLRIHVYEKENKTFVACRMPSTVFSSFNSSGLVLVAKQLDEIFSNILRAVEEV